MSSDGDVNGSGNSSRMGPPFYGACLRVKR